MSTDKISDILTKNLGSELHGKHSNKMMRSLNLNMKGGVLEMMIYHHIIVWSDLFELE